MLHLIQSIVDIVFVIWQASILNGLAVFFCANIHAWFHEFEQDLEQEGYVTAKSTTFGSLDGPLIFWETKQKFQNN